MGAEKDEEQGTRRNAVVWGRPPAVGKNTRWQTWRLRAAWHGDHRARRWLRAASAAQVQTESGGGVGKRDEV